MGESRRHVLKERDPAVLLEKLRAEQAQYGEGTIHWALVQDKINQIIAENFLHYVNR
jgi:hypothetical protein